jgi:hypothetical protein
MPRHSSLVLPIAYRALRILIVLNWLFGAGILALLASTLVNAPWAMKALGVSRFANPGAVLMGMRAIAALGLVSIPLVHAILTRLLAMVVTVRVGDPFVPGNAHRLQGIAWVLLALQFLSLVIAGIVNLISTPTHPFDLDAGFSVNGWLAVILTFVLARVFAEGTLMREDLEGTV